MIQRKAFKYRVYPTVEQLATLERWIGALRFIWNLANEQRLLWMARPRGGGRYLTGFDQGRQLTEVRREVPPWIAGAAGRRRGLSPGGTGPRLAALPGASVRGSALEAKGHRLGSDLRVSLADVASFSRWPALPKVGPAADRHASADRGKAPLRFADPRR